MIMVMTMITMITMITMRITTTMRIVITVDHSQARNTKNDHDDYPLDTRYNHNHN